MPRLSDKSAVIHLSCLPWTMGSCVKAVHTPRFAIPREGSGPSNNSKKNWAPDEGPSLTHSKSLISNRIPKKTDEWHISSYFLKQTKKPEVQRNRRASCSGRGQTDHVPVTSLCVQGQRGHAQLVRRGVSSGRSFAAADLEGSVIDAGSGKPESAHSRREIQRHLAGRADIWHVSWPHWQNRYSRAMDPYGESFSSADPEQDSSWDLGYCKTLVLGAPFWYEQLLPVHSVFLTGSISLPWNNHHVVGANRQVLNNSSKLWLLYKDMDEVQSEAEEGLTSNCEGWGRLLRGDIKASLPGRIPQGGHSGHREKEGQSLEATAQSATATSSRPLEQRVRERSWGSVQIMTALQVTEGF